MKKYGTYVQRDIPLSEFGSEKLNGLYDLSFFLDYPQYRIPGLGKVEDGENLVPLEAMKSNVRAFIAEYDETVLSEEGIQAFVSAIPPEFDIRLFSTPEEFSQWIRNNTSLEEVSPGKFLTHPAYEMMGVEYPARYFTV